MLVHCRVTPSIKFTSTHLYTWVERGNVKVKCSAQEHNTMYLARALTRTARSGDKRTNHEATTPPTWVPGLCEKYVIHSSWKYTENSQRNLSTCKITINMFSFFLSSFKAYSTMEEHTCLTRENTSNLLLNSISPEPFQVDKGQASFSKMTTLGAGNMALATPATASEEDHTTTKRKTRDIRTETPEEQVC